MIRTIEARNRVESGTCVPHSGVVPGHGAARFRASGRHDHEHGAAMVEFAMVFILLFIVITLIAEGGFFFSTWLAATNGAREGARFGAPCLNRNVQPCTETDVIAMVNDRTAGFLDQSAGRYSVTVSPSPLPANASTVTVTVTATVSSVSPILPDLPVYGESTMRLETSPN